MTKCDVCYGTPGKYPVIDRFGHQLYEIDCPECGGDGEKTDDSKLPTAEDVRGLFNPS